MLASPEAAEPEVEVEQVTYTRKKPTGGREAKLEHLPVETIVHELPAEERYCPCCSDALHEMSTVTRMDAWYLSQKEEWDSSKSLFYPTAA
ncbi:hypothetical protein SAMN04488601_1223 [Paenibacillus sp. 453mf]|nr:hypothetical protein SAMN04488601_1223 [Paenibacillus sp. 453mf]